MVNQDKKLVQEILTSISRHPAAPELQYLFERTKRINDLSVSFFPDQPVSIESSNPANDQLANRFKRMKTQVERSAQLKWSSGNQETKSQVHELDLFSSQSFRFANNHMHQSYKLDRGVFNHLKVSCCSSDFLPLDQHVDSV